MSKLTNKGPYRIPNKEQYHEILKVLLKPTKSEKERADINIFSDTYRGWIQDYRVSETMPHWHSLINFQNQHLLLFEKVEEDDEQANK